jgi:hypothetical protein
MSASDSFCLTTDFFVIASRTLFNLDEVESELHYSLKGFERVHMIVNVN